MLIAQMTINFHGQRAAVFMTEPAAHCGNINTRLDAKCRKKMPQIVMRETGNAQFLAG